MAIDVTGIVYQWRYIMLFIDDVLKVGDENGFKQSIFDCFTPLKTDQTGFAVFPIAGFYTQLVACCVRHGIVEFVFLDQGVGQQEVK